MKFILSLLLLLSLHCSAQQTGYKQYLNNDYVSDDKGMPQYVPNFYYPANDVVEYVWRCYDRNTSKVYYPNRCKGTREQMAKEYGVDIADVKDTIITADFRQASFSYELYVLGEPILYNKYLGKTVYRLVCAGGLFLPQIIEFVKDADSQYVYIKTPQEQIENPFETTYNEGVLQKVKPFNRLKVDHKIRILSLSAFDEAEHLFQVVSKMPSNKLQCDLAFDTPGLYIEVHTSKGYKLVHRQLNELLEADVKALYEMVQTIKPVYEMQQEIIKEHIRDAQQSSER